MLSSIEMRFLYPESMTVWMLLQVPSTSRPLTLLQVIKYPWKSVVFQRPFLWLIMGCIFGLMRTYDISATCEVSTSRPPMEHLLCLLRWCSCVSIDCWGTHEKSIKGLWKYQTSEIKIETREMPFTTKRNLSSWIEQSDKVITNAKQTFN